MRLLHGVLDSDLDVRILNLSLHAPRTAALTHLALVRPYVPPKATSSRAVLYVPPLRVPWACTLAQLLDVHLSVALRPIEAANEYLDVLPSASCSANFGDIQLFSALPKFAQDHNDVVLARLSTVHLRYVALCAKIAFLNSIASQVASASSELSNVLAGPRFKHCSVRPCATATKQFNSPLSSNRKRRCHARFILYAKSLPCSSSQSNSWDGEIHNSGISSGISSSSNKASSSSQNGSIDSNFTELVNSGHFGSNNSQSRNCNIRRSNNSRKVLINGSVIPDDILKTVNEILNHKYNIDIKLTNGVQTTSDLSSSSTSPTSTSKNSHHYIGSISSLSNQGTALHNNITHHNLYSSKSPPARYVSYHQLYSSPRRSSSAQSPPATASTSIDSYLYDTFGTSWKALLANVMKQADQIYFQRQHQQLNHLNQTHSQILAMRDSLVADIVELHMVGESLASISAITIVKENLVNSIEEASRHIYLQFLQDVAKRIKILQQKDCKHANQLALNYYQKTIKY